MTVEIYHGRLRRLAIDKIRENHAAMDKGVAHDEYMKLVGRNRQLVELLDWMKSTVKELGAEIDDDIEG